MKALILAAGYGTRLGELTKQTAKPLLDVAGKPLINYILAQIEEISEVDTIYIVTNNTYYHQFVDWKETLKTQKHVEVINDLTNSKEERLGAVGDINFVVKQKEIQDDLLVVGGDNLFSGSFLTMAQYFKARNTSTLGVIDLKQKEKLANLYGVVETNKDNLIVGFEEKPAQPKTSLAATCIYFLKKDHLAYLDIFLKNHNADNNGSFIQFLITQISMYAYTFSESWIDIGDLEELERARELYKNRRVIV